MEFLYSTVHDACDVGQLSERRLLGAANNPGLRLVASDECRCAYVYGRVATTRAGAIDSRVRLRGRTLRPLGPACRDAVGASRE